MPEAAEAARPPIRDLPASPALSILANGPDSFAGRKIGVLVSAGIDAAKLADLRSAADAEQVSVELVAPVVGGIQASDGNLMPADQKIDGGPSVLYDAIIVLAAKTGAQALAALPAARDFVTDAYAHCKFIGYVAEATPLFEATGLSSLMDGGFVSLDDHPAADFIARCAAMRFWDRQLASA
jgi:catalase